MRCDRKNCTSDEAIWSPILLLYAPAYLYDGDPVPIQMQMDLRVCEAHKLASKVTCFLTDETWARIERTAEARHIAVPQRDLTRLDWMLWEQTPLFNIRRAQAAHTN